VFGFAQPSGPAIDGESKNDASTQSTTCHIRAALPLRMIERVKRAVSGMERSCPCLADKTGRVVVMLSACAAPYMWVMS
jgi:hypothetical protein